MVQPLSLVIRLFIASVIFIHEAKIMSMWNMFPREVRNVNDSNSPVISRLRGLVTTLVLSKE